MGLLMLGMRLRLTHRSMFMFVLGFLEHRGDTQASLRLQMGAVV